MPGLGQKRRAGVDLHLGMRTHRQYRIAGARLGAQARAGDGNSKARLKGANISRHWRAPRHRGRLDDEGFYKIASAQVRRSGRSGESLLFDGRLAEILSSRPHLGQCRAAARGLHRALRTAVRDVVLPALIRDESRRWCSRPRRLPQLAPGCAADASPHACSPTLCDRRCARLLDSFAAAGAARRAASAAPFSWPSRRRSDIGE